MFSYRHAYHAGNHADVLKHLALVAVLRHLALKPGALQVFDSHAGVGQYRLDADQAQTSGEAQRGIQAVWAAAKALQEKTAESPVQRAQAAPENVANQAPSAAPQSASSGPLAPALADYLGVLADFNPLGCASLRHYPGSPAIARHVLAGRGRDSFKLCELHPTDGRLLTRAMTEQGPDPRVHVLREDGFEAWRRYTPPPSRRGLLLCDPSYEIKTDYARVAGLVDEALTRFPSGCILVWMPILPRPEAHELPRRLGQILRRHQRPWLHASLSVRHGASPGASSSAPDPGGLPGSALFVVNPPHTLAQALRAALAQLAPWLPAQPRAQWAVQTG